MSLPYTLEPRQVALYTEVCDLYRPVVSTGSEQTYELAYEDIPAIRVPTDNFDQTQGPFRLKQNNIQTSDGIHFHVEQDCGPEWLIHVKTGSVRDPDTWYVTLGAGEKHAYRGKYQRFYINNVNDPDPSQFA